MNYFIQKYSISLDSKSRLVLPAELRKAIGLGKDDLLVIEVVSQDERELCLKLRKSREAREAQGLIRVSRNCYEG